MTDQIRDVVTYQEKEYTPYIPTDMHAFLFNPGRYGMMPVAPNSACGQGFLAGFKIIDDRLYLTDLGVHFINEEELWVRGPIIRDVEPSFVLKWGFKHPGAGTDFNDFNNYYALRSPINLSGPLLLGRGGRCFNDRSQLCGKAFIREYEETIGPIWCYLYETLLHLEFKNGRLIKKEDLSDLNKKYRVMVEAAAERQRKARAIEEFEKSQQPFNPDDEEIDEEPPF